LWFDPINFVLMLGVLLHHSSYKVSILVGLEVTDEKPLIGKSALHLRPFHAIFHIILLSLYHQPK
jgi:hypothetical protein